MTAKHTPTPWKVVTGAIFTLNNVPIANMDRERDNGTLPVERDLNAHFIVKACNSHDALVGAVKRALEYLTEHGIDLDGEEEKLVAGIRLELNEGLELAEGK